MPGLYTITQRSDGEGINSVKYMADHQQHVDNLEPPKVDDYSGSIPQMQATADPGEVGSESQATSLAGELERLRFAIKEIKGTAQWYQTATMNLTQPAIPPGVVLPYGGITAPTGYLLADGAAVSRTAYAALFAVYGLTYGSGDGSTTFNLPNYKGRLLVGLDAAQNEFHVLGQTGGAKTSTAPDHQHYTAISGTTGGDEGSWGAWSNEGQAGPVYPSSSGHYHAVNLGNWSGGVNVAQTVSTLSPFIVANYIVKT